MIFNIRFAIFSISAIFIEFIAKISLIYNIIYYLILENLFTYYKNCNIILIPK